MSFFSVYINDLLEGLTSNTKLFADNTSTFSVARGSSSSSLSLDEDLIQNIAMNVPMKDVTKFWCFKTTPLDYFPTHKTSFNHTEIDFNNMPLKRKSTQKHLVLYLDDKRNFSGHINEKIKKAVKDTSVIKKAN